MGLSLIDACFETNHRGLNSLEDLNSVDRGRSFGREGADAASEADGVCGTDDEVRPALGDDGGIRKWKGTAVGEGCGESVFSPS